MSRIHYSSLLSSFPGGRSRCQQAGSCLRSVRMLSFMFRASGLDALTGTWILDIVCVASGNISPEKSDIKPDFRRRVEIDY